MLLLVLTARGGFPRWRESKPAGGEEGTKLLLPSLELGRKKTPPALDDGATSEEDGPDLWRMKSGGRIKSSKEGRKWLVEEMMEAEDGVSITDLKRRGKKERGRDTAIDGACSKSIQRRKRERALGSRICILEVETAARSKKEERDAAARAWVERRGGGNLMVAVVDGGCSRWEEEMERWEEMGGQTLDGRGGRSGGRGGE